MKIKAVYTSVFDDKIHVATNCLYDEATKTVSDIEPADEDDEDPCADAMTDEFVTLAGGQRLRAEDGVIFDY